MRERNHTIDILKGFAILLIVYLHMPFAGARSLTKLLGYIQTVNMPLFPFVSGFITCGRTDIAFGKYFGKKARALLLPYSVFFIIGLTISQIISYCTAGSLITIDSAWIQAFLLTGKKLFIPNTIGIGVLWYFQCAFCAYIIFWFVSRITGKGFFAATIIFAGIALWFQMLFKDDWTTPFNIKIVPLFVFYMCFGAIFKAYFIGKIPKSRKLLLSITLLTLATIIFLIKGNLGNINHMRSFWFLPVSLMQITAWYGVFSIIKRNKLLEYFGRHSLYIYGIHVIFLRLVRYTHINITDNYFLQAIVFATDIALCCLCFEAYERIKFKLVGR